MSSIQFDIECGHLSNGNWFPAIVCFQRNNEMPKQYVLNEYFKVAEFCDEGTKKKVARVLSSPDGSTCDAKECLMYLKRHSAGSTLYAYNLPNDLKTLAKVTGRDLVVSRYKNKKLGYSLEITENHPWFYEEWFWKTVFPEISHMNLFDIFAWTLNTCNPRIRELIPDGPGYGRYFLKEIHRALFPNERTADLAHQADYDCKMSKDILEWFGETVPKSYMCCTHMSTA
jgi:hypothetical protein